MGIKHKILVVDDHPFMRELAEEILCDSYQIIHAANGFDALKLANIERPVLILLDVEMPGIDGYETCRQLKSESATALIPVIFVSACSLIEERLKGYDVGGNDYIVKPFDPYELKAKIGRFLGVMQRIHSAELTANSSLAALDRLPSGVLLIDSRGEVTFANLSVQHMLKNNNGLRLYKYTNTSGLGKLVADNKTANSAITHAINAILNTASNAIPTHFSRCISVPQTSGLASYTLQISELRNSHNFNTGENAPTVIIFIADGHQPIEIDPELLKNAYGLTPAESHVALSLIDCDTIKNVADQLGIGAATVRFHIKQIYSKLGVNNKASFIKLMMGLAGGSS